MEKSETKTVELNDAEKLAVAKMDYTRAVTAEAKSLKELYAAKEYATDKNAFNKVIPSVNSNKKGNIYNVLVKDDKAAKLKKATKSIKTNLKYGEKVSSDTEIGKGTLTCLEHFLVTYPHLATPILKYIVIDKEHSIFFKL